MTKHIEKQRKPSPNLHSYERAPGDDYFPYLSKEDADAAKVVDLSEYAELCARTDTLEQRCNTVFDLLDAHLRRIETLEGLQGDTARAMLRLVEVVNVHTKPEPAIVTRGGVRGLNLRNS